MLHQKNIKKLLEKSKIAVSMSVLTFIISSVGVFPVLGEDWAHLGDNCRQNKR
jgi:hypothetical protein